MKENVSTASRISVGVASVLLLLVACHKVPTGDEGKTAAGGSESSATETADEGVSLKPEEVAAMGIATTEAKSLQSAPEVQGFGVVLAHEALATAVAELRTAIAAEHQSRAALARTRLLSGTAGAMPAETQETAERQATADQAALELARQKLSSSFGLNPPWRDSNTHPELLALASGRSKLVHVTFPLGLLGDNDPTEMRFGRIDGAQGGKSWQSSAVWHAPADATVPGRSYFAILEGSEVGEGDHLLAWTPVGESETGVLVPAPAAVISGGKFYCYVEQQAGTFVRTEFDPGRPTADGYFVQKGIAAGEKIVTHAAGQLLARETNPSKEAE
jgi:hypothetical protein